MNKNYEALFAAECLRLTNAPSRVCISAADYAAGDLARMKMELAVRAHVSSDFVFSSVANFDTRQLGYYALISMLAPSRHQPAHFFGYFNVAPIPSDAHARNGGHAFYAVLLSNGRIAFTPNAGLSLSYLRPYIVAHAEIDAHCDGKQFRSWQCFPEAIGKFLKADFIDVVSFDGDLDTPPLNGIHVAGIDNYGNLETDLSVTRAEAAGLQDGDSLEISLGGDEVIRAVYGAGPGEHGEQFTLAPSSKIIEPVKGEFVTFHDIFVLGKSAAELAGLATPGARLLIRKFGAAQSICEAVTNAPTGV